jgi:hypothetical protein
LTLATGPRAPRGLVVRPAASLRHNLRPGIYKCTSCGGTWNRPVLERRHVRTIDPVFPASLRANDPDLMRRLAFDTANLRREAEVVEEDGVAVRKEVLSENLVPTPLERASGETKPDHPSNQIASPNSEKVEKAHHP